MAADTQLRRRLVTTLVVTAVAASALLPFTFWLTHALLQTAALQDLLTYELTELGARNAAPLETDTGRSALRYLRPNVDHAPLPPEFAALAPGFYGSVKLGERRYAVQVRDFAHGDRGYIAYDIGFVDQLEFGLWMFVMALAGMIGLIVWIVARRMVERALDPFAQLLRDVLALVPGRGGQRINATIRDRDLGVILIALNRYLAQIDALVERERTFAAAASHELRTPLTVIQGAVSALEDVPQVPERVRARLHRAVREMRHDLDALLALSHAQDPPLAEELTLATWLPPLAEATASSLVPAPQLAWSVRGEGRLLAPPGVIGIVFSNLLRNAARAARGGVVTIEIDEESVAVRDTGAGIPATELPHIFQPRFRGPDGGSGMGLYIAKTLADRYGWRLSLSNEPDGGVRARVQFNAAVRAAVTSNST
jgi:signal transduction histidine kinase